MTNEKQIKYFHFQRKKKLKIRDNEKIMNLRRFDRERNVKSKQQTKAHIQWAFEIFFENGRERERKKEQTHQKDNTRFHISNVCRPKKGNFFWSSTQLATSGTIGVFAALLSDLSC